MLKRLYVDNYRCLSNFKVKPGRLCPLVGPNGGGKSSVFEVLKSLQGFLQGGELVETVAPHWSLTRWDTRRTQRIELECELEEHAFHYQVGFVHDSNGSGTVVQEETLSSGSALLYRAAQGTVELFGDDGRPEPRASFPFVANRSYIPLLESRPDHQRIADFKRWLSGLYLFSLNPWSMDMVSQHEGHSIAINGSNFVSWFRSLVQEAPEIPAKLREDLAPVIPGLQAIRLQPVGQNARLLLFDCKVAGRQVNVGVNELSDGQRVLLVLYTILHVVAPRSTFLVLDEPDNFVAQSEIQPWLSALRETVMESGRGTLLVISHHPEVIDYLAADEALYLWRREDGPTQVKNLASELDRSQGLRASEWLHLGAAVD